MIVRQQPHLVAFTLVAMLLFSCGRKEPAEENNATPNPMCEEGTRDCACYGNGTCNEGLECSANLCIDPASCADGSQGCACYGNGTCDSTLECVEDICQPTNQPSDMGMEPVVVVMETQTIGAQGGTVAFEGGELRVPPGAVAEDTEITVSTTSLDPGVRYETYGVVYEFGPSGLQFAQPVTVELPRAMAPDDAGVFWSRKDAPGFDRLPTTFDGNVARAEVTHFSNGFMGNEANVPLEELPVTCLEVDVQGTQSYAPAAVRASFVLRHCDGPPVVQDLSPDDIEIINDATGAPFNDSLEGGGASAPARLSDIIAAGGADVPTVGLYAVLSLDFSNSIVDSGNAGSVVDAAQQLVDELVRDAPESYRYQVAIQVFGRTDATQIVQNFTSDYETLTTRLDDLRMTEGLGTTNLYGAYTGAIDALASRAGSADIIDQTLLIVTDGRHEAGDFDNQRQAALAARDAAASDGVAIYSVAVNAPPADLPFLRELATNPSNFSAAATSEQIRQAFERTAEDLRRLPEATYVVGICTPVELGNASFSVGVDFMGVAGTGQSAYDTTPLTGNVSTCDPVAVASPCSGKNCGEGYLPGFNCGACEGGQCEAGICMCPQDLELCTNECVSFTSGSHCGGCGNSCPGPCGGQGVCTAVVSVFVPHKSGNSSCALLQSGDVKCWGANNIGQLGDGTTTDSATPVNVIGLASKAIDVAAGSNHTCALLDTGGVQCWGYNDHGQLGDGTRTTRTTPVSVQGVSNATAVSIASQYSCALLQSGDVKCWGANNIGQLGDGTTTDSATPVNVQGVSNATAVSIGAASSCALLQSGDVKCWGVNDDGQLGDGTRTTRTTPVSVQGVSNATAVSIASQYSCALLQSGDVKCWGQNNIGQLGDGTTTPRTTPVSVQGVSNATAVSIGAPGSRSSCALLQSGDVKCWGQNNIGQLGDGTTTPRTTPVNVQGVSNATAVSIGAGYSCALLQSGDVKCWGVNPDGRLGDGTKTDSATPVSVQGVSNATAISIAPQYSCALLQSGDVKCWGRNQRGQLGDGTTTDSATPVSVQW